jgi:DNA-directed RNA polymerase subunit omega
MKEIVTEELLKKINNRFLLSIVAAKRARQIKDGAVPLVNDYQGKSDLDVALTEIIENMIQAEVITGNALEEAVTETKKSRK